MSDDMGSAGVFFYSRREWRIVLVYTLVYVLLYALFARLLPDIAIGPGYGIALAAIFFVGLRFWPVILFAALAGAALAGQMTPSIAITASIVLLQSISGWYLLKAWDVDPIFRRDKDALGLIVTLALIAIIAPTLALLPAFIHHELLSPERWVYGYVASLFSFLVVTPFLMRWFAKPGFNRTMNEIMEIFSVFVLLIMIDAIYYVAGMKYFFAIPTVYLVLIPFFFLSLRLRPRFVTLAILITALFAVRNFMLTAHEANLSGRMFIDELFIIMLAVNFFIITALEEHRRSSANKFYSQVATLKNAMARLSSESQAKNDFIAILAHELRNPLTPIVAGIELLKLRRPDEEESSVLNSMNDSMRTIKTLLNDLLDVSRISEGKVTLHKERIDIEPVLNNAVATTAHHRKERHQQLIFKTPDKPLFILADPVRIEQVFSNLLTNASKYSDEGDTVTLHVKENKNWVVVEVEDEGVGIHQEALSAIFEPFHQIQLGERTKEGLGIGLSLVRDFVAMHGGTVKAHSAGPGKGSRFIVRLPLEQE